MDQSIDVDRWITVAEAVVCDVDDALCALSAASTESTGGAEPIREGIGTHDPAGPDAPGVAERLKGLAAKLQVVAANLIHLADHGDLNSLVERLKITTAPAAPGVLPDMEVERLLAQLEESVPQGEDGA